MSQQMSQPRHSSRLKGEKHVKTPWYLQQALRRVTIDAQEAKRIARVLAGKSGLPVPEVNLKEPRRNTRVLGKCDDYGRVTLYHHSVWVLLHELAHALLPSSESHGPNFGRKLDELTVWYFETGLAPC
jgi:hypothetical protein